MKWFYAILVVVITILVGLSFGSCEGYEGSPSERDLRPFVRDYRRYFKERDKAFECKTWFTQPEHCGDASPKSA